jgi:hypothetical protein
MEKRRIEEERELEEDTGSAGAGDSPVRFAAIA